MQRSIYRIKTLTKELFELIHYRNQPFQRSYIFAGGGVGRGWGLVNNNSFQNHKVLGTDGAIGHKYMLNP